MRLRNIPGAEAALREYPTFVDSPLSYKGRWKERFGNDNPIHVEIGCGKGRFINTLAKRHPDTNFIAVELKAEVVLRALQRTEYETIPNLAFIQFDASKLSELFADHEIARIYLNFSDPWPKTRHAKRRLTYASFLNNYRQVLTQDGEIHMKTDNEKLFEFSLNQFAAERFQMKNITFDLHQSKLAEENVMTEYEERFSSRGQRIYRVEASCLIK
ncbi:tRNA (guanosine(46)-N7)-methyltransferase TrmB [Brevibacillus parabrevis]|uniref:tRNA (guanosine(46)-N7)-methyltransferase TrmB n=1 Tax=Brevibacillus parabrevis TaxID=54914 RepID=UPI002E22B381|nr:tRNA (guanosine(46)-N7)-methyltransferase TrmB [Brevibacillus parabrevis]MED1723555.1 tRNA (guanosine(46)-N7)-methyltransferase TrmB [Brevibacillus parabrevis]